MADSLRDLAKMIDHSLLHPTLTDRELAGGCQLARRLDVASVCVKPYAVPLARAIPGRLGRGRTRDEDKIRLCELCSTHRAAFVKTSTGYGFVRRSAGLYSLAGAVDHGPALIALGHDRRNQRCSVLNSAGHAPGNRP
jgi:deoxyribose-phosphate aldolase